MKNIILTISLLFASISALAGTCNLQKPIPINGDLLNGVHLKNVILDEQPNLLGDQKYDPSKDSLQVYLFDIILNNSGTGLIGSSVSVVEKSLSAGFPDEYYGDIIIQGSMNSTNGVKVYTTKEEALYPGPEHAKGKAITQTSVSVSNGKITAINLTYPIFKIWKRVDSVNHTAFTGEHQTVCVKSAE